MNQSELEQGRRVRLTVDLDGGRFKAGDTGFLFHIKHENDQYWGVVFDSAFEIEGDGAPVSVRGETNSGDRVRLIDVCEPIAPVTDELSEETQEIQPIDQQFLDAEQEMELIRQLATAHQALERGSASNKVTWKELNALNDRRESAIAALIKFCQARWLSDPVYAPRADDPSHVSISGKVF